MARPTNNKVLERRAIVKKMLDKDILTTPSAIKNEIIKAGINTTIQTIKNDIEVLSSEDNDAVGDGIAELEKVLFDLDKELEYNKRQRDHCKSEAAASQFSRLVKDILQKKADVASAIANIKLQRTEKTEVTYVVRIGDFPMVDKDE